MQPQIIFFTGAHPTWRSLSATACALQAAEQQIPTLLLSAVADHACHTWLKVAQADTPQSILPHLSLWEPSSLQVASALWGEARQRMGALPSAIAGDELPSLPGLDLILALAWLPRVFPSLPQRIVIDAGTPDSLIRSLALPDSARWLTRMLLGLDRGPGQSASSVAHALLPSTFIPPDWLNQAQNGRVQIAARRDEITNPVTSSARYILSPDPDALSAARVHIPALHMHGLMVDSLLCGPLLPDSPQVEIQALHAFQSAVADEAARVWSSRALIRFPYAYPQGLDDLRLLGHTIAQGQDANERSRLPMPLSIQANPAQVIFDLPGVPRDALGVSYLHDELIMQVGPYRRHILIGHLLQGSPVLRASREGDRLTITLGQAG